MQIKQILGQLVFIPYFIIILVLFIKNHSLYHIVGYLTQL